MPRAHKRPIVFLALSPTMIATAIGVNYERVIVPAIASGALGPVYISPTGKRKILCSDLERFVRSWPQHTKRKSP